MFSSTEGYQCILNNHMIHLVFFFSQSVNFKSHTSLQVCYSIYNIQNWGKKSGKEIVGLKWFGVMMGEKL